MSAVLIDQSLYPELVKLGIQQDTLNKLNIDYHDRIRNILTPNLVGMTLGHADDVVRWAMDASVGFLSLPTLKISYVRPPVVIDNPGLLGPVAAGSISGFNPSTLGNPLHWDRSCLPRPRASSWRQRAFRLESTPANRRKLSA
jgi:hypothetical protein